MDNAELRLREELAELSVDELRMILWQVDWDAKAHDHQKLPPGEWAIWLLIGGRGSGKTRPAAETAGWWAVRYPGLRGLVTAPTAGDLRDVCFEGDSGLLNVIPKEFHGEYNRSLSEMHLTNGSVIKGIPASEPERFRGPQFHFAWADELAAYARLEEAWRLMRLGIRLRHPGLNNQTRMICTTTPRPLPLMRALVKRAEGPKPDVVITRASTYVNLPNLSDEFRKEILQHEGTTYGRQEIHGEILDDEEQGIFRRSWFKLWPADEPFPIFEFIVQSWDTAFSEKDLSPSPLDRKMKEPDFTACTTWGVFRTKQPEPTPGVHNPKSPWAIMLLDAWQEHIGFPDLRKRALAESRSKYGPEKQARKPDLVLIENKGSGISLIQELRWAGVPCQEYNPQKDSKLQRAHVVSHVPAHGLVHLPESPANRGQPRNWINPWLDQMCVFSPMTLDRMKDDFVDSTTQAWKVIIDQDWVTVDPIPEPEVIDRYQKAQEAVNPYAL